MVEYLFPHTLEEALLMRHERDTILYSGGTDLMIQRRSIASTPRHFEKDVLFLTNIQSLDFITIGEDHIYIGAMTSLSKILQCEWIPSLLREAVKEMASPAIRNTATLAGNIGNASPAGDSLPVLYVLNALVKVESIQESRLLPIQDFMVGFKKIDLKKDEIITEIILPISDFTNTYYKKVGSRKSDTISKVSFSAAYSFIQDKLLDVRIAFGSVAIMVVRRFEIEGKMIGKTKEELIEMLPKIVQYYEPFIVPIDDQRSTKAYRKNIALHLLEDFLKQMTM